MVSVYYSNNSTGNEVYDLCVYKDPSTLPFNLPLYNGSGRYIYPILLSSQICTKWNSHVTGAVPNIVEKEFGSYDNFFIAIPEKVLSDVRSNICKIVFDYSNELADVLHGAVGEYAVPIIQNTMKKYNLHKDHVLFCTGNYKSTCEHESFHVCILNVCWQTIPVNHQLVEEQKKLISISHQRNKKILCLMRLPHSHRLLFGQLIHKHQLLSDNIVSLMNPNQTVNINEKLFLQKTPFNKEFIDSLPWIADIDHRNYKFDHNNIWQQTIKEVPWFINRPEEQQLYLQTYMNCVIETVVESTTASLNNVELDFSEKTFKPISTLQPFIVYGQPGILKYLRERGYKTFDRWWDESYDSTYHTRSRQYMVFEIFKKFSSASHTELASLLNEMLPVLEHNFELFADTVENYRYLDHFNQTLNTMFGNYVHSN